MPKNAKIAQQEPPFIGGFILNLGYKFPYMKT